MSNRLTLLVVCAVAAPLFLISASADAALIGHYPLDSIAGGTTPDSTGLNGDGALNGGTITQAPGVVGGSFDFAGGGPEFVGITDAAFGQSNFTASVWFNPDSLGNQGPLANWTNAGPSPRSHLFRTAGTTLQTFVRSGGAQIGGSATFPSEVLTTAGFNHAVITYDGQTMRTYLNGEESTNPFSFGAASVLGEGVQGTAAIGGRGAGLSERDMTGLVDDVAYWDQTLTGGQVAALHNVASEPGLNYDASQTNQLFDAFDGTTPIAIVDGKAWVRVPVTPGAAGEVTDRGDGNFFVNLDGSSGVATAEFKIDIDSMSLGGGNNTGPITTAAGFVSLDATEPSENDSVSVGGINFRVGSTDGSRVRLASGVPTPNPLTADFVFDDGAGQAVILFFGGAGDLPAGEWEVEVYAFENAQNPVGDLIVGLRTNNAETIIGNDFLIDPNDPIVRFTFESDGVSAYDVFVRENNPQNRARLSAVVLRAVVPAAPVPEPATATLGLLGLAALAARRRRRA